MTETNYSEFIIQHLLIFNFQIYVQNHRYRPRYNEFLCRFHGRWSGKNHPQYRRRSHNSIDRRLEKMRDDRRHARETSVSDQSCEYDLLSKTIHRTPILRSHGRTQECSVQGNQMTRWWVSHRMGREGSPSRSDLCESPRKAQI